ncbi:Uncharacterised protein [Paucimonas lemoignei]|nr:Uncharacterised protein [Paucimonas lemoignei]
MNASYPQPVVVEAVNDVLDPQNAISGATVRVAYAMEDTDLIGLAWDGRDDLAPPQSGNASTGTVDFRIPPGAVLDAIGREIDVVYAVVRNNIPSLSIVLRLRVESANSEVKPDITSVRGLSGDVDNGGITPDTQLTVFGYGQAGVTLEIRDGSLLLGTVVVESNGSWKYDLTALTQTYHSITARNAGGQLVSEPWIFTVQAIELDLPEPTVTQAPTGSLDPINAMGGATVVVTYLMQTTDTITLSWNGLDNLVPPQQGSTLGSVTFTIPASAVAAVIGKTIPVLYTVARNSDAKRSAQLDLTVQTLSDSVLEAPRIVQATDGVNLDVGALTGDADLRVKPWPFIGAGQLISLRFEGSASDGSVYNWPHPTWQNLPISSTGEPSTTVALSDLQKLADGSSLKLIFEVSFDGGETTLCFPVRTLTIRGRELVSGFEDWQAFGATGGHIFSLNVPLYCPSGLVATLIKDVPAGGFYTYVFNYAGSAEWALRVATGATIKFEFGGRISRLSFNHYWGIDNNWVNFYDESNNLVYVQHIVGQGNVDITLPSPCLWCWIAVYNASTGLAVDNVAWS